jgi:hypothetical protein
VKSEGARLAFEEHSTTGSDQIEAVGPTGVGSFYAVVEAVDESGKPDAQLADAGSSNSRAFRLIFGAGEENVVANIRLHLPNIGGMSLKNVDGVEANLVFIFLGKLVQGGNLPPKRRSGIAAEDENDRS